LVPGTALFTRFINGAHIEKPVNFHCSIQVEIIELSSVSVEKIFEVEKRSLKISGFRLG
jgi:hypothetical protein